jgi:hypothetical protein
MVLPVSYDKKPPTKDDPNTFSVIYLYATEGYVVNKAMGAMLAERLFFAAKQNPKIVYCAVYNGLLLTAHFVRPGSLPAFDQPR